MKKYIQSQCGKRLKKDSKRKSILKIEKREMQRENETKIKGKIIKNNFEKRNGVSFFTEVTRKALKQILFGTKFFSA